MRSVATPVAGVCDPGTHRSAENRKRPNIAHNPSGATHPGYSIHRSAENRKRPNIARNPSGATRPGYSIHRSAENRKRPNIARNPSGYTAKRHTIPCWIIHLTLFGLAFFATAGDLRVGTGIVDI